MPPRRELNERFRAYERRARRVRAAGTGLLVVCLLVGTGVAFAKVAPQENTAQSAIKNAFASVADSLGTVGSPFSRAANSITNGISSSRTQTAAASSDDSISNRIYHFFCPWFTDCEEPAVEFTTNTNPAPRPQPQQIQPTYAVATTTSQNNPAQRIGGTSTSQPIQQTVINQPVIERVVETVRTVVQGGVDETILDARLAALNTDLSNRMNQLALASTHQTNAIYNSVSAALNIEELTDLILHSPVIDGGSITGATISGTLSNVINSALATITSLTATELVATNATTTNLYVSGRASLPTTSVAGDLTVSGTITGGTLSVAGLSSSGALFAPYFSATSTTATSTFAGAIMGPGNFVVTNGGLVGIGTSTPQWTLNPFSASAAQLSLSAGAGIAQWAFRNAGGDLFFSTTTVAGTATTSTSALTIAGSGFGTTTLRGLSINGQATSTSNVGFNLTAGCFAVNGTCLSAGGSSFAYLFPSNATSTSLMLLASTTIGAGGQTTGLTISGGATTTGKAYFAGNVGVGTAAPIVNLDITGVNPLFSIYASNGFANSRRFTFQNITGASLNQLNLRLENDAGGLISTPLSILSSGNVGIGTTSPDSLLSLMGNMSVPFDWTLKDNNYGRTLIRTTWDATVDDYITIAHGGANADSSTSALRISDAGGFDFGENNFATNWMKITTSGNVGIGTSTPGATLDVAGASPQIRITDSDTASSSLALTTNISFRDSNGDQVGWIGDGSTGTNDLMFVNNMNTGMRFYVNSSEFMRATNVGNVGIGTTNPNDGKLEVKGGTVCVDTDSNDSATSCIANESDERLKTNIQAISASSSLDIINALNPVSFDWRANDPEVLSHYPLLGRYAGNEHSIGLIAQEVMPVLPEALSLETVGDAEVQYYQLDYTKFIPHLIGAMKELWAKVQDLGQKVAALFESVEEQSAKIQALEARVNQLEAQTGAAAAPVSPPPQEQENNTDSGGENATSTEPVGEEVPLIESEEQSESEPVEEPAESEIIIESDAPSEIEMPPTTEPESTPEPMIETPAEE